MRPPNTLLLAVLGKSAVIKLIPQLQRQPSSKRHTSLSCNCYRIHFHNSALAILLPCPGLTPLFLHWIHRMKWASVWFCCTPQLWKCWRERMSTVFSSSYPCLHLLLPALALLPVLQSNGLYINLNPCSSPSFTGWIQCRIFLISEHICCS